MTLANIPGPEAVAPLQNLQIPTSSSHGTGSNNDFPIPAYSSWFSFTKIHEIEKRAFPEFFEEGKKRLMYVHGD
jgi:hypothetical protein